jgi:hypothetical protein
MGFGQEYSQFKSTLDAEEGREEEGTIPKGHNIPVWRSRMDRGSHPKKCEKNQDASGSRDP